jgi:hypothetical protein
MTRFEEYRNNLSVQMLIDLVLEGGANCDLCPAQDDCMTVEFDLGCTPTINKWADEETEDV